MNRRSILGGVAAFAAYLALTGCGNELNHGQVMAKHYKPSETTTICIPTGSGAYTTIICEPSTSEPDWWLDLKSCHQDPATEKQKCVTGNYDIDQGTYDKTNIGDSFDARGKS